MKSNAFAFSTPFLCSIAGDGTEEKAKKLTVLIIEDEEGSATLLSRLLQKKFSARVEMARDLADARKAIALKPYDLICLDYELPDGDGFEFLADLAPEDMPNVIVVTGHTGEGLEAKARELGAVDFVSKDRNMVTRLTVAVERMLAAT